MRCLSRGHLQVRFAHVSILQKLTCPAGARFCVFALFGLFFLTVVSGLCADVVFIGVSDV